MTLPTLCWLVVFNKLADSQKNGGVNLYGEISNSQQKVKMQFTHSGQRKSVKNESPKPVNFLGHDSPGRVRASDCHTLDLEVTDKKQI